MPAVCRIGSPYKAFSEPPTCEMQFWANNGYGPPERAGDAPGLSVKVERDGQPLSFVLMPPDTTASPPPRQAFPHPVASGRVQLLRDGNEIAVVTRGVRRYKLLLSPEQFDFTTPFRVVTNDVESFAGVVEPSSQTLLRWAARDRDRTMLFGAELDIEVVAPN